MSPDELAALLSRTGRVLAERIDAAFDDVASVRDLVSDIADRAAKEQKPLDRAALTGIRALVLKLLNDKQTLLEGLGVAVGEDSLSDTSQWSEWWRRDAEGQAYFIRHVLNPNSVGFYDYQSREWFRLPTGTVRSHAVGPYIDAGGIDVCTVTLCMPVVFPSGAVSVVGGDLSIAGVEALLLRTLATRTPRVVLLAANGRVVASNTARYVTGARLRTDDDRTVIERSHSLPAVDPERVPWRLVALRDT